MGFWRRRGGRGSPGTLRTATSSDVKHLEEFAASRRGVEAYVEPQTTVTSTTVVLIAGDGEWTRRRVDGPEAARKLAHRLAIPVYDVAAVGYPSRMREWTARRKAAGDTGAPGLGGPSA